MFSCQADGVCLSLTSTLSLSFSLLVWSNTVVYFSALVLCLSQQMTSDRINLYSSFNSTSLWWENRNPCHVSVILRSPKLTSFFCRPPGLEHQILHPWLTVNLVVALLVGLAWIFIATRPDRDYTEGERKWSVLKTALMQILGFVLERNSPLNT